MLLFPHAACVVTLVDWLVHGADVIELEADSDRLKEAKELRAARTKQHRAKRPATSAPPSPVKTRSLPPRARSSPVNFTELPRVRAISNTELDTHPTCQNQSLVSVSWRQLQFNEA